MECQGPGLQDYKRTMSTTELIPATRCTASLTGANEDIFNCFVFSGAYYSEALLTGFPVCSSAEPGAESLSSD